jgi:hypothetical protein
MEWEQPEIAPQTEDPVQLVTEAFSRCSNYPKESAGIFGLAQGLAKAARVTGIAMRAIVERCAEISQWCPTDLDLMNVARELQPGRESVRPSKCSHGLCDGSGWRIVYYLWTWHGGESAWIEKTKITEAQYEDLKLKVDWNGQAPQLAQEVYSGAARCKCAAVTPQDRSKEKGN